MLELVRGWFDFMIYVCRETPALAQALQMYPPAMALGIYWTQGVKRAQRKKKWRRRSNLKSLELRALSGCLSGLVVALIAVAFHDLPNKQVLAHTILGGAAAPLLMMLVIETLQALATRFAWADAYLERIKVRDRRDPESPPPADGEPERRGHDESGHFWSNETRP